jgi:hypothetical protein
MRGDYHAVAVSPSRASIPLVLAALLPLAEQRDLPEKQVEACPEKWAIRGAERSGTFRRFGGFEP